MSETVITESITQATEKSVLRKSSVILDKFLNLFGLGMLIYKMEIP